MNRLLHALIYFIWDKYQVKQYQQETDISAFRPWAGEQGACEQTDGSEHKEPFVDAAIEIMERYGAYNAANLDGGTSTGMTVNYELINDPIDSTGAHRTRFVSTGFGLIE